MFKRNEGYALSYVLVVLLVLSIIATAVMAPPLRNLLMQQASIERMRDKYIAQGMIEQVICQLEHAATAPNVTDITHPEFVTVEAQVENDFATDTRTHIYTITANFNHTTIKSKYALLVKISDETSSVFDTQYTSYSIATSTEVGA